MLLRQMFVKVLTLISEALESAEKRRWLLLLCTMGFCSNALGNLLFGGEQSAKQAEFWTRIADADVVYVG